MRHFGSPKWAQYEVELSPEALGAVQSAPGALQRAQGVLQSAPGGQYLQRATGTQYVCCVQSVYSMCKGCVQCMLGVLSTVYVCVCSVQCALCVCVCVQCVQCALCVWAMCAVYLQYVLCV